MSPVRKGLGSIDVQVLTVHGSLLDTLKQAGGLESYSFHRAPDVLTLEVTLPKVQPDRIRVMVSDDRLAVGYAESAAQEEGHIANAVGVPLQFPEPIDVKSVRARYSKGVLTVVVGLPGEVTKGNVIGHAAAPTHGFRTVDIARAEEPCDLAEANAGELAGDSTKGNKI
jgi:HSP20 family molecular chaperone IbpA